MYTNSGIDAGVDPDWDPINKRWKGFDRPNNSNNKKSESIANKEL